MIVKATGAADFRDLLDHAQSYGLTGDRAQRPTP
jgi:hypothetical protein